MGSLAAKKRAAAVAAGNPPWFDDIFAASEPCHHCPPMTKRPVC